MDDVPRWVKVLVVGFGLLLAAVIVAGSVGRSSGPKWEAAPDQPAPAPAAHARPASETMTVSKILALGQGSDGKEICSCGFVEGTTSASTNTIYVTERRAKNRKEHPVGVMCVWDNYGEKNSFSLPYGATVCVRGTYLSGFLKPCRRIDKCP